MTDICTCIEGDREPGIVENDVTELDGKMNYTVCMNCNGVINEV